MIIFATVLKENVPSAEPAHGGGQIYRRGTNNTPPRESLLERYRVMESHYSRISTFFMHCWFVIRELFHNNLHNQHNISNIHHTVFIHISSHFIELSR